METRLILAYGLMLAMTLLIAGFVAYRIRYSRRRSYKRRLLKEQRAHDARNAPRSS